MAFILKQPDFGTSMVFLAITIGLFWIHGVKWQHFAIMIGSGLAVVPLLWKKLDEYQKMRLVVFLDLKKYASTKWAWHTIQSIIAIGSGRLWGKGLYHGTQTQLKFLPERHTDFIFSVIGEELALSVRCWS
jgi:rod shape determining protein RodA